MSELIFETEPHLATNEFIDVLVRSTLSERRPIDRIDIMEGMLKNADLIVTCRNAEGLLVGVSRAITDFHYCTYLSDLAVDQAYQKRGIGKSLIELTHQKAGYHTLLLLLSAPAAETYYPHVGMQPHSSAWIRNRRNA